MKEYVSPAFLRNMLGIDSRILGIFRILTGSLTILSLFIMVPNLKDFYTNMGVLPNDIWTPSLHGLSGSIIWIYFLWSLNIFCAFLLVVGYQTKLNSILTWVLTLSFYNRIPPATHGGDKLLVMLLFWGMFAPWDMRFSIDSALSRISKKEKVIALNPGTAGLVLQVPLVYLFSAIHKLQFESWTHDLNAVYHALRPEFTTKIGHFFITSLPQICIYGLTVGVLLVELLLPGFLLILFCFKRIESMRANGISLTIVIIIYIFAFFQFSLSIIMYLGLFPVVTLIGSFVLIPSTFPEAISDRFRKKGIGNVLIVIEKENQSLKNFMLLFREFLLPKSIEITERKSISGISVEKLKDKKIAVRNVQGCYNYGIKGFRYLVTWSPVIGFLSALLKGYIVKNIYHNFIELIEKIDYLKKKTYKKKGINQEEKKYKGANFYAGIAVFIFVLWSFPANTFQTIPRLSELAGIPRYITYYTRLEQEWDMFASSGPSYKRYFVIPGILESNKKIDLFQGGPLNPQKVKHLNHNPPASFVASEMFRGFRWARYFGSFHQKSLSKIRPYYAQYLCRRWNTFNKNSQQLNEIKIIQYTKPRTYEEKPEKKYKSQTLLKYTCQNKYQ